MKLANTIKEFLKLLNDDDIVVTSNQYIYSEVIKNKSKNIISISDPNLAPYVSLGTSFGTQNRVFFLCLTRDLQGSAEAVFQLAVSKKSNIHFIVFNTKTAYVDIDIPNIITSIESLFAVIHNSGIRYWDYSPYFNKVSEVLKIKGHINSLIGPSFVSIDVVDTKESAGNCALNTFGVTING